MVVKKDIYILGINGSHCATAALLKNGEIIAVASEERFTRIKNQRGYPKKAIEYCLALAQINSSSLHGVYVGFITPTLFIAEVEYKKTLFIRFLKRNILAVDSFFRKIIPSYTDFNHIYNQYRHLFAWVGFEKQQSNFLAETLKLRKEQIVSVDHHTAHAYVAYYSNSNLPKIIYKESLVVTSDGEGDHASSKIFLVKDNSWNMIACTPDKFSLGWLYANTTMYLGMKVNEDEYKVMGLAPYAKSGKVQEITKMLRKHWWVEGLTVKSDINIMHYYALLEKYMKKIRFDVIAASVQKLTEEILVTLVENALRRVKTDTVILGGGVFMNVKANMGIAKIKEIKNLYVCPSCADESTAIGAAYFGYKNYCKKSKTDFSPKPLLTLYLGPSFSSGEVYELIQSFLKKNRNSFTFRKINNSPKLVSQLLSQGEIVARFMGRMEYGARALGNRSILADPRNLDVVSLINEQIKGRDFWMPFAPVIIEERMQDYIINPKKINSPFMMLAFETTKFGRLHLKAAMHPSDFTVRPQILKRHDNISFYELIKEFEKLTGVGALLNTSFNLHGEPIVCTPSDAIKTFLASGLRFLLIEDYLLTKKIMK